MSSAKKASGRCPCYTCKFRGEVPGSAHSKCLFGIHALPAKKIEKALMEPVKGISIGEQVLLEVDPWGIENGWAAWPFNFDPVWIVQCGLKKYDPEKAISIATKKVHKIIDENAKKYSI